MIQLDLYLREFNPEKAIKTCLRDYKASRLTKILQSLLKEDSDFLAKEAKVSQTRDFTLSLGLSEQGALRDSLNSPKTREAFSSWRKDILRENLRRSLE